MRLRDGSPQEAGLDPDRIERVKKLCASWVDDGVHPALAVLVARRGVIALHEAYGRFGSEPDPRALTLDAIFPLASITKVFTATLAMQLVEDGVLGLTRPVQEYLPEFNGEGKEAVCVHHLLTHTSGMRDEEGVMHILNNWNLYEVREPDPMLDPVVQKQLELGGNSPLWKAPGEEMWYCNGNYITLGEVVRRVAGCSIGELARAKIFGPLGMVDTDYIRDEDGHPRLVGRPDEWQVFADFEQFRAVSYAAGAVRSTARDLAVFGQMFLNGGTYDGARVLSKNSVAEMTRNQIPGIGTTILGEEHEEASWSFGWGVCNEEKWNGFPVLPVGAIQHAGGSGTFVWFDPSTELVGVYLSVARPVYGTGSGPLPELLGMEWGADLFSSAVYAALED